MFYTSTASAASVKYHIWSRCVASMMLASVCLCWPLIPGGHWPVYDVQIVHVHVWCACCAYMMYQVATGQYDVQCCCHQVAWLPLWPASRWPVWEYADQPPLSPDTLRRKWQNKWAWWALFWYPYFERFSSLSNLWDPKEEHSATYFYKRPGLLRSSEKWKFQDRALESV